MSEELPEWLISRPADYLPVIPCSVIELGAQNKRKNEDHDKTSSRANYSGFPNDVADLCYSFYLRESKEIFDPFAGWGERHSKAKEWGKSYVGFDTSEHAIEQARENYSVENRLADSFVESIPEFDGLLTCPPYWNLEKYKGDGIDRLKTWDQFLVSYGTVLARCYEAARPGAMFCIQVGDWRSKGVFYDLSFETQRIFKSLGAVTVDSLIISRRTVSKIKVMLPQAKRLGYSVRVHENLYVFRK